jgi:hypothetical protein
MPGEKGGKGIKLNESKTDRQPKRRAFKPEKVLQKWRRCGRRSNVRRVRFYGHLYL